MLYDDRLMCIVILLESYYENVLLTKKSSYVLEDEESFLNLETIQEFIHSLEKEHGFKNLVTTLGLTEK